MSAIGSWTKALRATTLRRAIVCVVGILVLREKQLARRLDQLLMLSKHLAKRAVWASLCRREFKDVSEDTTDGEANRWLKGCYLEEDAVKDKARVLREKVNGEKLDVGRSWILQSKLMNAQGASP